MSLVKNKLISIFLSLAFLTQVMVPNASACWWKGLPSQSPGIGGAPSGQGGVDDDKPNQEGKGDDVFLHNGDFVYNHQDLFIPSRGLNLDITRTYKSQSRFNGRFGLGWELNYNKRVVPLSNGDVFYLDGEGRRHRFSYLDGKDYVSPPEVLDKLVQNQDGTYTLTKKDNTKLNFNPNGTLAEILDRNNNKLTFSYDQTGPLPIIGMPLYTKVIGPPRIIAYQYLLTKITDATERQISLSYDTNGRLTKITDFTGRAITYTYDDFGHLTSVTDPQGNTITYAYDSDRNLRSITDPKGNTYLTNTYNAQDRVIAQEFGQGIFYFSYDTDKRITKFTDRNGNLITYYFNEQGNPIKIVDPQGNTTTKTYDTNKKMLLTSVTYPKGNVILYEYDDRGNLTQITRKPSPGSLEPAIITSLTYYEPNYNFIKTLTDPKGNITTYDYDNKGNLIGITYPKVEGVTPQSFFSYNQYGQIETVTDPRAIVTKYAYDSTGYLIKIIRDYSDTTHFNATTQFSYDSLGNVLSTSDPKGNTTNFAYSALNQLTKTTSPEPFGYQTKYTYDANGNLAKLERQFDDSGLTWQVTEYEYDSVDQLTKIKQRLSDAETLITQFQYDANGNRTQVTDPQGNSTTYTYDTNDLLVKVTDAEANATQYSYDENGNLKEIKDAKANITTYAYDDFDRLSKTTYADNSQEEYTYDASSNLKTKTDPKNQTIYYDYDALNRLTEKGLIPQGTVPESVVSYSYDLASRLSKVTDTNGSISYAYDALNRIAQVTTQGLTPQGTVHVSYEYDSNSNRTKLTYPDNTDIAYTYDELNRLTAIKDQTGANIASYSYDALSRRTQQDLANNTQTTYTYDAVNRLTSLMNKTSPTNQTINYTYDNVGNRLSMTTAEGTHNYTYDKIYQLATVDYPTGYFVSDTTFNYDAVGNRASTVNGGTTTYTSNKLNQYTKAGSTNYTYDANGSLTDDGTWTYAYDYENRLTSATKTGTSATYTYDAFGRRVEKTVGGTTTKFLYDGDQLIAEYDGSGNLINKYIFGTGIDEPIKGLSPTGTVPEWFYHFDGLGSVTNLTNSSGSAIETYSYDTFGKPNTTSTIGNRFMFTGREYDAETGLYYYRERYYSPVLGRFLQRDPVGYWEDLNLYRYCNNNPLNWVDPWGLEKIKKTGWWPKELDLVVPGYRKYGGPSRGGPGSPEDLMDQIFQRHDVGYSRGELEQADLRLIYDLSNLPDNPRQWGPKVNPIYARTYRIGAYTVFSTRLVIINVVKETTNAINAVKNSLRNSFVDIKNFIKKQFSKE